MMISNEISERLAVKNGDDRNSPILAQQGCPRCGLSFECKSGNINQCQCYHIAVSTEVQLYISKQFTGCLCSGCIEAINRAYNNTNFATDISSDSVH